MPSADLKIFLGWPSWVDISIMRSRFSWVLRYLDSDLLIRSKDATISTRIYSAEASTIKKSVRRYIGHSLLSTLSLRFYYWWLAWYSYTSCEVPINSFTRTTGVCLSRRFAFWRCHCCSGVSLTCFRISSGTQIFGWVKLPPTIFCFSHSQLTV